MTDSNVSQDLVLVHLNSIIAKERAKDEAVGKLRAARKLAKGDGVDLKKLDAVRALLKLDEGELADDFNGLVKYAKFLDVPIYAQLDMFESAEITEETVRERAYAAGLRAGKMGADQSTNPHDPGAPAGQSWLKGWFEGQQILLSAIKEIPPREEKEEAPKRRGRPPKSVDSDLPM